MNKKAIIEITKDQCKTAAKLCAEYDGGGQKDWFLPSIDEVKLMHKELVKAGVDFKPGKGDDPSTRYWSSTESTKYHAHSWSITENFDYSVTSKHFETRVRAIRAF